MSESARKIALIRELASRHGLEAVLLRQVSNFAWATCGASAYVNIASNEGVASLLITADHQYLLTDNIEAIRLDKEEKLASQGWDFRVSPWFEKERLTAEFVRCLKTGADGSFPGALNLTDEIVHLRANLTPEEGERFRTLGLLCAQAIESAARAVRPGQSEYEIAALLASETERRGVQPTVNLIATDDRIYNFRHPLPTNKKLEHYAMLILCGRKHGLVCSATRLVYFGRLPDKLRCKAEAVAQIDAALIAATRPGRTVGEAFQRGIKAYASHGYPDEWRLHHQGGPAGYEPREYLATPDSSERVASGQVYAWNPSITGVKSEDTILIGKKGNEVLTHTPEWPTITVEVDSCTIDRPAILEIT